MLLHTHAMKNCKHISPFFRVGSKWHIMCILHAFIAIPNGIRKTLHLTVAHSTLSLGRLFRLVRRSERQRERPANKSIHLCVGQNMYLFIFLPLFLILFVVWLPLQLFDSWTFLLCFLFSRRRRQRRRYSYSLCSLSSGFWMCFFPILLLTWFHFESSDAYPCSIYTNVT